MEKRVCHLATGAFAVMFVTLSLFSPRAFAEALSPEYPVPYRSISPQEESAIERTAMIALRHISQARTELYRKAPDRAKTELAEADRLIAAVRDYLSPASAKSLIQMTRRHLEYDQAKKVLADLPAIEAALQRASVYVPTDRARAHLAAARKSLEQEDRQGAERELARAEEALQVVDMEPALVGAQQYLKQAQGQLSSGDTGKADDSLQSAERQVLALYTGITSQLHQAKQNLWQAFKSQGAAEKGALGQYLARAREFLAQAAVGGNTTGKVEAGRLASEVGVLEQEVRGGAKAAQAALQAVWEKCSALAERSAAYLAGGFSETATALWQGNDLIEARLHLGYARTYQVTTGEPEKAAGELAAAHSYLEKASRNTDAGEALRKKVREIDRMVEDLKKAPEEKGEAVQERYERARGELGALIQKI